MAFSRKLQKKKGKIFVMLSDGECQEGTTWESFLISSKHKLDNLIVIIDYNKIQALDTLENALPLHDLKKKLLSFNINVINIVNGHSFNEFFKKFAKIKNFKGPIAIILNTIKGKGIKEFENDPVWHARKLDKNEIAIARKRLGIK
jgi:transketolase